MRMLDNVIDISFYPTPEARESIQRHRPVGMGIMGLADAVPERIASAVMLQPIGFDDNRQTFFELFDGWTEEVKPLHPSMSENDWINFRSAMFGGDFLFNVSVDFVSNCQIPLLVLMGGDIYHPEVTSRRVVELAPRAILLEHWQLL